MKKFLTILGAIVLLSLGVLFAQVNYDVFNRDNQEIGYTNPGLVHHGVAKDIIGTRLGTTTVGFWLRSNAATTTFPTFIGADTSEVIYTMGTVAASSTASVYFNIVTSNDAECDTATTSTSLNNIVTGDINWFDASTHLKDLAGVTELVVGDELFIWRPTAADQRESVILKNLNSNCIAIRVNGASTTLWVQMNTR